MEFWIVCCVQGIETESKVFPVKKLVFKTFGMSQANVIDSLAQAIIADKAINFIYLNT
jgi:hypothetical protein